MAQLPQRWFRFYSEALSDRKLARIAKTTGIDRVVVLGAWVGLLCLASDSPDRGALLLTPTIPLTVPDLAEEIGCQVEHMNMLVAAFASLDMVVWDNQTLRITHWSDRQFDDKQRPTWATKMWRIAVFSKDDFTCQQCGQRGGKLNAHHLRAWSVYPEARYDPDNGITLCRNCHSLLHRRESQGGAECPG